MTPKCAEGKNPRTCIGAPDAQLQDEVRNVMARYKRALNESYSYVKQLQSHVEHLSAQMTTALAEMTCSMKSIESALSRYAERPADKVPTLGGLGEK